MKKTFFLLIALSSIAFLTCAYTNVSLMQDVAADKASSKVASEMKDDFEDSGDFSVEARVKEEIEREMVLGVQNLETKTKLTKEERAKYYSVYKEMPKTVEEYKKQSQDIKREDRKNVKPIVVPDKKLVKIPEPRLVLTKYNYPAGTRNIDLRALRSLYQINSTAVISPNKDKMVYTTVYYEGHHDKISSELYYLDLDKSQSLKNSVKNASIVNKKEVKLMETGTKESYSTLFRTLTVLDWSADGRKIAIKERVGSTSHGVWQTNLWVYDFEKKQATNLVEVREAVKYWWKTNKNLFIDDYMWDIVPLGWDDVDKDRIVVVAYAYTKNKSAKYLGLFSVDSEGKNTQRISENPMSVKISSNGLMLKSVGSAF